MVSVLLGTAGLVATVIFNFVECLRLALQGTLLSFPQTLDQKYLILLAWGFLVPVVWGFSARWLPAFLAISKPDVLKLRWALALDLLGVLCGVAGWIKTATVLLACGATVKGTHCILRNGLMGMPRFRAFIPAFRISSELLMHGWW